jgi:hypothetical protein
MNRGCDIRGAFDRSLSSAHTIVTMVQADLDCYNGECVVVLSDATAVGRFEVGTGWLNHTGSIG